MAVWEWHWDFYKLMQGKEINAGHSAVVQFQEHCQRAKDKECLLMTFKMYVRSLFNYAAPLVFPNYSASSISRL